MIGSVEVFGNRSLPAGTILDHLPFKPGDSIEQETFEAEPIHASLACWKSRSPAYAAFVILGRLSGTDEKTLIEKNFSQNEPAEIERMLKMGVTVYLLPQGTNNQ